MSIAYGGELYANVVTPGGGSGATTQGLTLTASAAPGLVIAITGPTNFGTSTVTDSKLNTWTKVTSKTNTGTVELWWTLQDGGTLASGDVITLHFAGTVFNVAALVEYFTSPGGWAASPVDVFTSANGATTARDGGTTAATAQAEELVIGAFSIGGTVETAFTPGAGYSAFTSAFKGNGGASVMGCYLVTSGTGAQHATGTGGASIGSEGITATFKNVAGGGGGSVNTLALLGVGS